MAVLSRAWIVDRLARNLRLPQKGIFGWLTLQLFKRENPYLERNVVRLANIKPDHTVLEIGFGPGLGLESAYSIVKNGKGKVFGIDPSFYMLETARHRMKKGIQEGKVFLFHASVDNIPLNTDSVHRVIHCNSYYFWPSMRSAMREIYRVMQPGGVMVTTLNLERLKHIQDKGFLKFGHPDPVKYMRCLENYGFENVHLEYHKDPLTGRQFQAIFAEISEKPAHDKYMYSDDEDEEMDKKFQEMLKSKVGTKGP